MPREPANTRTARERNQMYLIRREESKIKIKKD